VGDSLYGVTDQLRLARARGLYTEDDKKELYLSHDNPYVKKLYKDFLKEPLGKVSHELLHTHYKPRPLYRK